MTRTTHPLTGQAALVTGASRGIGFAIARRLGRLGARLALTARSDESLRAAAASLSCEGIECVPIPADLRHPDQIVRLAARALESLGEVDILVNNAGIGLFRPVGEISDADWDAVLDTNLRAVFQLCRAIAPGMIARGRGSIVNIASLAGKNAFPGGSAYCASKWGLLGFTSCLAEELRSHSIRVSAICPGTVATEFSPHAGKDAAKMLQPEDVAQAVELVLLAAPGALVSEVDLRPTRKP